MSGFTDLEFIAVCIFFGCFVVIISAVCGKFDDFAISQNFESCAIVKVAEHCCHVIGSHNVDLFAVDCKNHVPFNKLLLVAIKFMCVHNHRQNLSVCGEIDGYYDDRTQKVEKCARKQHNKAFPCRMVIEIWTFDRFVNIRKHTLFAVGCHCAVDV